MRIIHLGFLVAAVVAAGCSSTEVDRAGALALAEEAEALMMKGELEDALDLAEDALDRDPDCVEAILVASRSQEHLGRPAEALALLLRPCSSPLVRAIRLEEAAGVASRMHQPSLSVTYLNLALEIDVDSPRLIFQRGLAEAACSWEQRAVESFNRALELGGDAAEIRPPLARAYIVLEEYDLAAALLENQRRDGALTAEETVLLGVVRCRQRNVDQGLALFRKAAGKDENLADAPFNEGVALEKLEDEAGAEAAYRQAIRIDPRHAAATYQLARILLARGQRAEGLRLIDQAIEFEQDVMVKKALEKSRDELTETSDSL